MLFSHYSPIDQDLVKQLLGNPHVKKAYVLNWNIKRSVTLDPSLVDHLEHEVVTASEFLALEGPINKLYEVRRDAYGPTT